MILSACAGGDGGSQAASIAQPAQRRFVEVQWTDLWTKGGTEADTVLLLPFRLTADGENAYVIDRGAERVVAFRLTDGGVAWMVGRKGGGPGEFLRAQAVAPLPSGEVAVADVEANRMTLLDARTGAVRRIVPLDGVPHATSICGLRDGSFLISTIGVGKPVLRLASDGTLLDSLDLAWPDLNDDRPIRQQGSFYQDERGRCTYLLTLGRGFTRFEDGGFRRAHRYVEWHELPEVEEYPSGPGLPPNSRLVGPPQYGVMGAGIEDGKLEVAFYGESADRGRLVDVYDAESGAYLHSYRTPHWFQDAVRSGDVWVFLQERDGYPTLVAARVRTDSAGAAGR